MAWNLVPKVKKKAPRALALRYNLSGWYKIREYLNGWGVDISEFSDFNDGDPISPKTCQAIADMIEVHWSKLSKDEQDWLTGHAKKWRQFAKYRGCLQW